MLKYVIFCGVLYSLAAAEPPVQGVKPSNVLGSPEQHASFSFIRPGLTQTSFSFGGPSSHQSFSSSIGNPQLVQRVLPNLAQALAYRNQGLGVYPYGQIANNYQTAPFAPAYGGPQPLPYQVPADHATTLAYLQQLQQIQQLQQPQVQAYSAPAAYQAQLAQLLALRQAHAQQQAQVQAAQQQQDSEQPQLQQQEQQPTQNLLGVAYSAAPSVAHVKVSGNGYKFDF